MLNTKPIPTGFPDIPVKPGIFRSKDEVVAGKPYSEFESYKPLRGSMGGILCSIGSSVLTSRAEYVFTSGSQEELATVVKRLHTRFFGSVGAIQRSFFETDRPDELEPDILELRDYPNTGTVWQKHHKVIITADKTGFVEFRIKQLVDEEEAKECFELVARALDRFLDHETLPVQPRTVTEAGPHLDILA